jgi:hypothetical protein
MIKPRGGLVGNALFEPNFDDETTLKKTGCRISFPARPVSVKVQCWQREPLSQPNEGANGKGCQPE